MTIIIYTLYTALYTLVLWRKSLKFKISDTSDNWYYGYGVNRVVVGVDTCPQQTVYFMLAFSCIPQTDRDICMDGVLCFPSYKLMDGCSRDQ